MELNEKANNDYKRDKAAFEKLQGTKEVLQKKSEQLATEEKRIARLKTKLEWAKEDKNDAKEKEAKEALERAEKRRAKLKADIQKIKDDLVASKGRVDSYIEELKKDPEFEAKVNEILEKRYNRQLNKHIMEFNQLNTVIRLCEKHPTLGNNLKGMIHAQEDLRELQEQLEPLDYIKDKDKIEEIKTKIDEAVAKKQKNLDMFMDISAKSNVSVSREFLEKLVEENGFSHDGEGNVNLDKSLKNIAKGYQKRIQTYEKAIAKIPNAKVSPDNTQALGEDSGTEPPASGSAAQQGAGVAQQGVGSAEQSTDQDETTVLPPAEKLHWWQFKKRFDAWRQRRQEAKAKETEPEPEPEPGEATEPEPKKSSASDKFRDAYKYDIVKDYVDAQEQKLFRETGREVRKSSKSAPTQDSAQQTQEPDQQPTQDQDSGR